MVDWVVHENVCVMDRWVVSSLHKVSQLVIAAHSCSVGCSFWLVDVSVQVLWVWMVEMELILVDRSLWLVVLSELWQWFDYLRRPQLILVDRWLLEEALGMVAETPVQVMLPLVV